MRRKQFNIYFNKLIDYCKLMNIKLYTSDTLVDSVLIDKREIIINKNTDYINILAATLHEIGHLLDYYHNSKLFLKVKAYNALIKNPHELTYYERKQLILLETRAWDYAKSLSHMLKIKIELDTIRASSLKTYYVLKVKPKRKAK